MHPPFTPSLFQASSSTMHRSAHPTTCSFPMLVAFADPLLVHGRHSRAGQCPSHAWLWRNFCRIVSGNGAAILTCRPRNVATTTAILSASRAAGGAVDGPPDAQHCDNVLSKSEASATSTARGSSSLPLLTSRSPRSAASSGRLHLSCSPPHFTISVLASSLCMARRHASTAGRRPTFAEISEALTVLGVSIDEESKVLKAKYRELVKKNHPDAGGEEATMARVTVAYERLSELTTREKEEYKAQRRAFHGGGGASMAGRRYRPSGTGGFQQAAPRGPFEAYASQRYGQYYQQDANSAYQQAHGNGQQSYWRHFYRGGGGFSENPFSASNPFSMHTAAQRARQMPVSSLLLQGFVVYLVLSVLFLFVFRAYRDWRHDDGWHMSESLARHEQMQEMHRIRQELNDRARAMLLRDSGGPNGAAAGGGPFAGARQYVGESPEARALEYARRRRIEMLQEQQEAAANLPELRGWPSMEEEKGRIIKRAQDPPGVVFFEPRKEDSRRRQIENQRRGSWSDRQGRGDPPLQQAASNTAATGSAQQDASENGGVQHGSTPLPPEVNVGSIIMKPVDNEQEAQAVMHGIFSGLRRGTS